MLLNLSCVCVLLATSSTLAIDPADEADPRPSSSAEEAVFDDAAAVGRAAFLAGVLPAVGASVVGTVATVVAAASFGLWAGSSIVGSVALVGGTWLAIIAGIIAITSPLSSVVAAVWMRLEGTDDVLNKLLTAGFGLGGSIVGGLIGAPLAATMMFGATVGGFYSLRQARLTSNMPMVWVAMGAMALPFAAVFGGGLAASVGVAVGAAASAGFPVETGRPDRTFRE